jgi:hypothetical protein
VVTATERGHYVPDFYITWRQPGVRVRAVIVIVIYVMSFRLAPHLAIPLAASGLAGGWLATVPTRPRLTYYTAGGRGR